MTYKPLPGDTITKGNLTLHVDRVFPAQVVFHFTQAGGPPFNETIITPEEFDTKAQGSVTNGAAIWRGGVQLLPEISETMTTTPPPTGITGSANVHARLSPSDSKRWSNCTSSIAFQEANAHRVPKDNSTDASREGTEAHEWAAKLLTNALAPIDIPESFRSYVVDYANHCLSLVPGATLTHLDTCIEESAIGFDPPTTAYFVEEEIPLFYQEEQTGTADFMALQSENGEVTHVFGRDYKHGAGVLVTTAENTQLAIYVMSAITKLEGAFTFTDSTMVDMSVIQPRHREAESQTPWIITLGDLRTFCREIEYQAITAREAANRVRERIGAPGRDVSCEEIKEAAPGAAFRPSEGDSGACRWCKCKAFCTARLAVVTEDVGLPHLDAAAMLAAMPDLSKDKSSPAERIALVSEVLGAQGRIITDEYLVNLVGRAAGIRKFLADAEEYLESRLLDGEEIEGVKLVDGREGNRAWADETAAETFLRGQGLRQEERFDFVLKSPAKVEAILKDKLKSTPRTKSRFESLITRSSGKKKLAIAADSRQAVPATVSMMPVVDDEFEV